MIPLGNSNKLLLTWIMRPIQQDSIWKGSQTPHNYNGSVVPKRWHGMLFQDLCTEACNMLVDIVWTCHHCLLKNEHNLARRYWSNCKQNKLWRNYNKWYNKWRTLVKVAANYHLLSQIPREGHTTSCNCMWWHISLTACSTTCRSLKSNTHHI